MMHVYGSKICFLIVRISKHQQGTITPLEAEEDLSELFVTSPH